MTHKEIELIDNQEERSYELWIEDKRSFIDYKLKDGSSYLLHTEVPGELEGQGVAAALVEKTLSLLQQNNLKVVPVCSYVQIYLKRHPKWNHLVADSN